MKHRRKARRQPLRAEVINAPSPGPAPRPLPAEVLFAIVRNAGRILGALCGGMVIGCHLVGHDVTIPALAGAALGVNELLYHLAETLGSRKLRALPAYPALLDHT